MVFSHTKLSNNRSVMPLDVRGCTRATLEESACLFPGPKGLGKPLKTLRDWDRELQLFPLNEEFPVSVSHQLTLITSLPFVHTARRCPGLSCFEKCGDRCCGASALRRWKPYLSQWLEPGKSRNKVAVEESAAGSLTIKSYRSEPYRMSPSLRGVRPRNQRPSLVSTPAQSDCSLCAVGHDEVWELTPLRRDSMSTS